MVVALDDIVPCSGIEWKSTIVANRAEPRSRKMYWGRVGKYILLQAPRIMQKTVTKTETVEIFVYTKSHALVQHALIHWDFHHILFQMVSFERRDAFFDVGASDSSTSPHCENTCGVFPYDVSIGCCWCGRLRKRTTVDAEADATSPAEGCALLK